MRTGDASAPAPLVLPQRALLPVLDLGLRASLSAAQPELQQLKNASAALAGHGALVMLEGEAGVGKTRVGLSRAAARRRRGATVISGTCQMLEQELPFAPLADAWGAISMGCQTASCAACQPPALAG